MIAVLGALREELHGIHRQLHLEETPSKKPWRLFRANYANREILLVHTGMGRKNAQAATEFIMNDFPISTIISLGFAGALDPGLAAGDLVLCQKLLGTSNSVVCSSDPELAAAAMATVKEKGIELVTGSSVTADRLVSESDEKTALGTAFGARIVEMESYWIARTALARRVAFLAVRAISDPLDQNIPPFDRFMGPDGAWRQADALRFFLTSPRDLARLPRVFVYARRARESLARFFCAYLPKL